MHFSKCDCSDMPLELGRISICMSRGKWPLPSHKGIQLYCISVVLTHVTLPQPGINNQAQDILFTRDTL